jgi:hypothetical protein
MRREARAYQIAEEAEEYDYAEDDQTEPEEEDPVDPSPNQTAPPEDESDAENAIPSL